MTAWTIAWGIVAGFFLLVLILIALAVLWSVSEALWRRRHAARRRFKAWLADFDGAGSFDDSGDGGRR